MTDLRAWNTVVTCSRGISSGLLDLSALCLVVTRPIAVLSTSLLTGAHRRHLFAIHLLLPLQQATDWPPIPEARPVWDGDYRAKPWRKFTASG